MQVDTLRALITVTIGPKENGYTPCNGEHRQHLLSTIDEVQDALGDHTVPETEQGYIAMFKDRGFMDDFSSVYLTLLLRKCREIVWLHQAVINCRQSYAESLGATWVTEGVHRNVG